MASLDDRINDELNKYDELIEKIKSIKESSTVLSELQKRYDELEAINNRFKELQKITTKTKKEAKEYDELLKSNTARKRELVEISRKLSIAEKTITNDLAQQEKHLKNGYTWIDKFNDKLSGNGFNEFSKSISQIKLGGRQIYNTVKDLLGPWGKASQSAADYAKKIGISQKAAEGLRKNTIQFVNAQAIGAKYNKSIDELIKLQGQYASRVGRNISITDRQRESLAAMSAVIGDDMAVDLTSKLENFGLSATEAGKRVGKIFNESTKKGIVFEQYAKNFADNIKIAQNYTFKNGLKGLSDMAEKATAVRLNMSQASAFADKVSTVEGAITTGAQLQVLGGPFAQYSNPMSLLYEGLNDLEALQNRIIKIYSNIGKWNSERGEVEISAFNRLRMKQFAQATGMDYSNLMESIQTTAKQKEIENRYGLQYSNLSAAQKEFIKNTATYDAKSRQFGLSDKNGNFISINELIADNKKLQEAITVNQSESDDIKTIATILRGWNDSISGLGKQADAVKAQMVEQTKIGPFIQNTLQDIGKNTALIKTFLSLYYGGKLLKGLINIGNGSVRTFRTGREIWGNRRDIFNTPNIPGPMPNRPLNPSGSLIRRNVKGQPIWGGKYGGRIIPKSLVPSYEEYGENLGKYGNNIFRRGAKRSLTRAGIKFEKILGRFGGAMKAGSAVGLAGLGIEGLNNYLSKNGVIKEGGKINNILSVGSGALSGAGFGTAIGSALGTFVGPLGTAIGAAIGGSIGGYINHRKNVKNRLNKEINDSGYALQGQYTVKSLKRIQSVLESGDESKLTNRDIRLLQKNNDYNTLLSYINSKKDLTSNIENANMNVNSVTISSNKIISDNNNAIQFAKGGILKGPSHKNGGMQISGTNQFVEGGEFIVNKHSTKKYFGELVKINNNTSVKPIEPLGKIIKITTPERNQNNNINSPIKIDPININLNGTIKLDTGKQNIDITNDIISNPTIIKELVDMISKQINVINNNGSFNKRNFKQKWI